MGAQLSMKTVLRLAERLATASYHSSNTGPGLITIIHVRAIPIFFKHDLTYAVINCLRSVTHFFFPSPSPVLIGFFLLEVPDATCSLSFSARSKYWTQRARIDSLALSLWASSGNINKDFSLHNSPNILRNTSLDFFFLLQTAQEATKLDSTRRKAAEICLRPPLDIYSHTFSR